MNGVSHYFRTKQSVHSLPTPLAHFRVGKMHKFAPIIVLALETLSPSGSLILSLIKEHLALYLL